MSLWVNDRQIGEGRLDHTCAMLFTTYAGMDMGRDNGGVVDEDYADKAPYAFTGTLRKVTFDLKPESSRPSRSCTSIRRGAARIVPRPIGGPRWSGRDVSHVRARSDRGEDSIVKRTRSQTVGQLITALGGHRTT